MYNFIRNRKIAFIISISLMAFAALSSFVFRVRLDIQFKGGSIVTYAFSGELDSSEFQSAIEGFVGERVTIQEQTDAANPDAKNYVVSLISTNSMSTETYDELLSFLNEAFPERDIRALQTSNVEPTIGREFFAKCLVAVAFSSVLMVIYIALRFKKISGWSAGIISIIALIHDVVVVYASYVVFRFPINDYFIAVVLIILGYSINDTIIVYDRLRENRRLFGVRADMSELMNKSINQSLGRSVATTATTVTAMLIVTIVALIYGIGTIVTFTLPLIVGLISGLYSSLFLVGPLWVLWQERDRSGGKPIKAKA